MKTELVNGIEYPFVEKDGKKYYWDFKHSHFFSYYDNKWWSSRQIDKEKMEILKKFFDKGGSYDPEITRMVVSYAKAEIEDKIRDIEEAIGRHEVRKILDAQNEKANQYREKYKNE